MAHMLSYTGGNYHPMRFPFHQAVQWNDHHMCFRTLLKSPTSATLGQNQKKQNHRDEAWPCGRDSHLIING